MRLTPSKEKQFNASQDHTFLRSIPRSYHLATLIHALNATAMILTCATLVPLFSLPLSLLLALLFGPLLGLMVPPVGLAIQNRLGRRLGGLESKQPLYRFCAWWVFAWACLVLQLALTLRYSILAPAVITEITPLITVTLLALSLVWVFGYLLYSSRIQHLSLWKTLVSCFVSGLVCVVATGVLLEAMRIIWGWTA